MRPGTEEVVIQAHRFELIDAADRVRAVLGVTSTPETGDTVGLELFDRAGSARAWLLDEGDGPVQLALAVGGNQLVIIRASSASGASTGGSSITLCDLSGQPVFEWVVGPDGEAEARRP